MRFVNNLISFYGFSSTYQQGLPQITTPAVKPDFRIRDSRSKGFRFNMWLLLCYCSCCERVSYELLFTYII